MKYRKLDPNKTFSLEQLKNKILYFINYRPRSLYEIKNKLLSLNASSDQISFLIDELSSFQLINDEKIISLYIREFLEVKQIGLYKTSLELKKKGFSEQLIQDALVEYCSHEEYSEETKILELLTRKYAPPFPDQHKMLAFLIRRGFSYQHANKTIKKFLTNNNI